MESVKAKHIGVYGIIMEGDQILVIKKNRGPYKGKFDLPGGSLEYGEEIEEGLRREIQEEVNGEVTTLQPFVNMSYVADWIDGETATTTYHIGMYYIVELNDPQSIKTDPDGHDSDGSLWVDVHTITADNIAPIAYKALRAHLDS